LLLPRGVVGRARAICSLGSSRLACPDAPAGGEFRPQGSKEPELLD
jgi:hypothetical protein